MTGASDLQVDVSDEICFKTLLFSIFLFTQLTLCFEQQIAAIKVLERRTKERDGTPCLWHLLVFYKSYIYMTFVDS